MTVRDKTKDKIREIRVRNKLRAESHLPPLSITKELGKANDHAERMAFEAFAQQERPKYQHMMMGADGFMSSLARHAQIMKLIRQDYEKRQRD
jgi:hypothetical protein